MIPVSLLNAQLTLSEERSRHVSQLPHTGLDPDSILIVATPPDPIGLAWARFVDTLIDLPERIRETFATRRLREAPVE